MIDLLLIGIGTGNPDHLTLEAVKALKSADLVLLPLKGEGKSDLADVRRVIVSEHLKNSSTRVVEFQMPTRDATSSDYIQAVQQWHDAIAAIWQREIEKALPNRTGQVALLVWGDPSLYDSTLRIASRLQASASIGNVRVVPGLTSIQLLTAAHGIPLNEVGESVVITTGRKLARDGWPANADTIVVMLDGQCAFTSLSREQMETDNITIWWGAYLGLPQQIIIQGPLIDVADKIVEMRRSKRAEQGWIMDTYLLRRSPRCKRAQHDDENNS